MDKSFLQYLFSEDIIYKIPADAANKQDLAAPVVKVPEEFNQKKYKKL
jgi:hypothetical protein